MEVSWSDEMYWVSFSQDFEAVEKKQFPLQDLAANEAFMLWFS